MLVTVAGVAHTSLEVRAQVITEVPAGSMVLSSAAFVPAFTPFICHWYTGAVPPLIGVAIKDNRSPVQAVEEPDVCAVNITGFTLGLDVSTIAFEVSGLSPGSVITQVMFPPVIEDEV